MPGFGHDEGNQLVDAAFLAQHHGSRAHAGLAGQHGFNLAQLDPKAANLHLVVGAAQALHAAVGVDAGQVAGAVQPALLGLAGPGIGEEFFSAQVGPAQVALRHARPGDAKLADFATRQQAQAGVRVRRDDQQAVIGQRPAYGDGLVGLQFGQAGRDRGFGWAVGVEYLAPRPRPARHQRLRAHLAAQVDDPQAGHVLGKQRQQRRYGVQHGYAVVAKCARQRLGVGGYFFGRNPQCGASQVADPDFLERHVKGD